MIGKEGRDVLHALQAQSRGLSQVEDDSHAETQRESGLHLSHLLRDIGASNLVVMLFQVEDLAKAKAFAETPDAAQAGKNAGVVGPVEFTRLRNA